FVQIVGIFRNMAQLRFRNTFGTGDSSDPSMLMESRLRKIPSDFILIGLLRTDYLPTLISHMLYQICNKKSCPIIFMQQHNMSGRVAQGFPGESVIKFTAAII